MGHILWLALIGVVIGALARLFMKGEQNIGILWTMILGAGGSVLGGWITEKIAGQGHDVISFIVGVIVAMALIALYLTIRDKGNTRTD